MFCRSFLPDKIDDVVVQWQTNLSEDKPDVAATITCPGSHPEMWPLQEQAMKIQSNLADLNYANSSISASQYNNLRGLFQRDLFTSGVDPSFDVSAGNIPNFQTYKTFITKLLGSNEYIKKRGTDGVVRGGILGYISTYTGIHFRPIAKPFEMRAY